MGIFHGLTRHHYLNVDKMRHGGVQLLAGGDCGGELEKAL